MTGRNLVLALLFSALVPGTALAAEPISRIPAAREADQTVRPIAVLVKYDPWLMVIGSDMPVIAVYNDGTMIRRRSDGYWFARMDAKDLQDFRAALNLDDDIAPLKGDFDVAPLITDLSTDMIYLDNGRQRIRTTVYGGFERAGELVPERLAKAFNVLNDFDRLDAVKWLPEKIEVMAWPYDYAPDESIVWPKDWPGLEDPETLKREEGLASIYVPSELLPQLQEFLKTEKPKGAVQFGARKMSVSLRLPFPGEKLWAVPIPDPE